MRMIMAIHWGSPVHDGNLQFFGLTGITQFSTIYSIQYGCFGCQNYDKPVVVQGYYPSLGTKTHDNVIGVIVYEILALAKCNT